MAEPLNFVAIIYNYIFSKDLTHAGRKKPRPVQKLTGNATEIDVPSNATINVSTERVIKTSQVRVEGRNALASEILSDSEGEEEFALLSGLSLVSSSECSAE